MSVGTTVPNDTSSYKVFCQNGLRIYYSPKLGRASQTLELDFARVLFRGKPILSGPEELMAAVLTGRF